MRCQQLISGLFELSFFLPVDCESLRGRAAHYTSLERGVNSFMKEILQLPKSPEN
jgi:hypothetical protein